MKEEMLRAKEDDGIDPVEYVDVTDDLDGTDDEDTAVPLVLVIGTVEFET